MNIPELLEMRGKDLQLGDFGQTTKFIADKLKAGWVILIGDIETINMIEEIIYTPGTEKNEGFAFVMGKILPEDEIVSSLFLAKKTDLFKQRIMYWNNIKEETFDKLIMINIIPVDGRIKERKEGNDGVIWDYTLRNENEVGDDLNEEKFYDDFAKDIVENILKMEK